MSREEGRRREAGVAGMRAWPCWVRPLTAFTTPLVESPGVRRRSIGPTELEKESHTISLIRG